MTKIGLHTQMLSLSPAYATLDANATSDNLFVSWIHQPTRALTLNQHWQNIVGGKVRPNLDSLKKNIRSTTACVPWIWNSLYALLHRVRSRCTRRILALHLNSIYVKTQFRHDLVLTSSKRRSHIVSQHTRYSQAQKYSYSYLAGYWNRINALYIFLLMGTTKFSGRLSAPEGEVR